MTEFDLDLITRCLAGRATPDDRARFEQWLAESPDNWLLVKALREVAVDGDAPAAADWKGEALAALRGAMVARGSAPEPPAHALQVVRGTQRPVLASLTAPSQWRTFARAAAIAALVTGAVLGGQRLFRGRGELASRSVASAERTVTAGRGQRITLRLFDGTSVTLAPGSTLRTMATFGARERIVQLDGEAIFSVTHDAARPFEVRTARVVARDLGTRFVVRSYPGDSRNEVVVAEGLVAVRRADLSAPDTLLVRPGDRAEIASSGRVGLTHGVALDTYFDWAEGRLLFRATPLGDAAAQLSRWYDVDVNLASPALRDLQLHASFQNETADEALRVVAATMNLDLAKVGRVYTLRAR